jgi:hypothetical protein
VRVAEDVADGLIDRTAAETVYKVALTADGKVDAERTKGLRAGA